MSKLIASNLSDLLNEITACQICEGQIPAPRPVLRAESSAKLLIVGQAPGTKVHASGIPWDDASGKRLREWMGIDSQTFYDSSKIAIIPMGFCYPGKGRSGDLPPRPECAPTWHEKLMAALPAIECKLLIGNYAQRYYLSDDFKTLTDRVRNWRDFAPDTFVLPHPSPRNRLWLKKNSWFEADTVPVLQKTVQSIL